MATLNSTSEQFSKKILTEFKKMLKPNGVAVVVIGEVAKSKTTRIWRETKGKATATDRIIILSDVNPFENNQRLSGKSVMQYDQIKGSTKHFMGDLIDV